MPTLIKRSKRGFAYQTPGQPFPDRDTTVSFSSEFSYDPIIDGIFRRYRETIGQCIPPALILKLVERMTQLIGQDFGKWVWIQIMANRALHGEALKFLKDTLLFTTTGYRALSIGVWYNLIDVDPPIGELDVEARKLMFKDVNLKSLPSFYQDWLSQKGGIDDMFLTAHILFGNTNSQ